MKRNIKYFASAMLIAVSGAVLPSCCDWTEPESLDIKYTPIEEVEGYAEYCAKIREYRATDHRLVYAWFGNVDQSNGQGQRITSLPDSVDVIVLNVPGKVSQQTLSDMSAARNRFGMKVIYTIDFDKMMSDHTLVCEDLASKRAVLDPESEDYEEQLEALTPPALEDFILENLTEQLTYVQKVGFDGVMFAFDGKMTTHLSGAELTEYKAQMLLCLGAVADWHKRFPDIPLDYLGNPQYIAGTDYIDMFGVLFMRQGLTATNVDQFGYIYNLAAVDGVPAGRLGMVTTCPIPGDGETGYFADKSLAIDGLVKWAAGSQIFAVGVYNANYDYYNGKFTYPHLRNLIQALNPSIK